MRKEKKNILKKYFGENKMSKEKMSKKEIVSKRKDYSFLVDFFKEIKEKEILVCEKNREILREIYFSKSNNKVFSNIERVLRRSLREEIKGDLINYLEENNLSLNEYLEFKRDLILVSREYKKGVMREVKIKV